MHIFERGLKLGSRKAPFDVIVVDSGNKVPACIRDGAEDVRCYQLFLIKEKRVSQSTLIQTVCALRLLAVQGVHPKAIQCVLGWDQIAMVDRYAQFADEMKKDAATKMEAIWKPNAVEEFETFDGTKAN